jgi:hypothetical protein
MRQRFARWRNALRERPTADVAYRSRVAVIGVAVLTVGIIATEFRWARRLLTVIRARYDLVMVWVQRQGLCVQAAGIVLTTAVVVTTLWVVGVVGWSAGVVGVEWPWLDSTIGLGS